MSTRQTVRRGRRKLCLGDLRDRICLQTRSITEPAFGSVEPGEDFVGDSEVWALVKTTAGKVFFNGVNADLSISHEILIRYDPAVTAETWRELEDGRRLDIVNVEDLEDRKEYLRLFCTDRGTKDQGASSA